MDRIELTDEMVEEMLELKSITNDEYLKYQDELDKKNESQKEQMQGLGFTFNYGNDSSNTYSILLGEDNIEIKLPYAGKVNIKDIFLEIYNLGGKKIQNDFKRLMNITTSTVNKVFYKN